MKKSLISWLTCAVLAWLNCLPVLAEIPEGSFSKGDWRIMTNSRYVRLYVSVDGTTTGNFKYEGSAAGLAMTNAPWYRYQSKVDELCIVPKGDKDVTRFGNNAFAGMKFKRFFAAPEWPTRHNAINTVEEIGDYCFYTSQIPDNVTFASVTSVSEGAFRDAGSRVVSLPLVKKVHENAFSYQKDVAFDKGIQYIDLGSQVTNLYAGSLAAKSLWKNDYSPSVFIQSPTPPEWVRLYEYWATGATYVFAYIFLGGDMDRSYCYPLGDKPAVPANSKFSSDNNQVLVVVPDEYLNTYKGFYQKEHPETERGYMTSYYTDGNRVKNGKYASCGRFVAGEPIYKDGLLIGWWYVNPFNDGTYDLHIGTVGGEYTLPAYTSATAPWRSKLTNQVNAVQLHNMDTIAPNGFANGALKGVKKVYFTGMDTLHIGANAFKGCTDLKEVMQTNMKSKKIVLNIGDGAFMGCTALAECYSGLTAISVGKSAFEGCTKLWRTPHIEAEVIGERAFANANVSLQDFDFTKVKKIEASAFEGASFGLGNISLGNYDLITIGKNAFKNAKNLKNIYVVSYYAPNTASDAFSGVNLSDITLHVAPEKYADYEKDAIWGKMKVDKAYTFPVGNTTQGWKLSEDGILTITKNTANYNTIQSQPWYQYRECIRNIVITNGVTSIGARSFAFPRMGESHAATMSSKAAWHWTRSTTTPRRLPKWATISSRK